MKKCPTCGSRYSDESLNFCLTDGAPLFAENDPDATVVMVTAPGPKTSAPIQPQQTTKPHLIYAGAGLVAVIVIIGTLFLLNRPAAKPETVNQTQTAVPIGAPTATQTPPRTIETREVLVPANEMWFDTGVTLTKGAQLNLRASGQWSDGGVPLRFWGPNGTGDPWPGTIVAAANLDALVGKIGTTKFVVGDSYSGRAPESGTLRLSINDTPDSFSGNKGSMRVEVSYSSY
jgi:hypothetical protein